MAKSKKKAQLFQQPPLPNNNDEINNNEEDNQNPEQQQQQQLQQQLDIVCDDDIEQQQQSSINDDHDASQQQQQLQPPRRKKIKRNNDNVDNDNAHKSDDSSNLDDIFDNENILDKLPLEKNKLQDLLIQVNSRVRHYRNMFFTQQTLLPNKKSHVGEMAIPICGDVTKIDFDKLITKQLQVANREFDVLMMDPPWRLSSSQPSRGVAIQYQSLSDQLIGEIPVEKLQKQGFLFVWVINAKFQWTVNTMQKKWGYKVVDSINWVKKTVNGRIAKGHGFYLQHAKQTCLVGYKGDFSKFTGNVACDIIFSDRRGQSQKPTEIYEYIQELVPNGYYLEIFGRRNNLRDKWVTVGNQL